MFKKIFLNQTVMSLFISIILIIFIVLINNKSKQILDSFLNKVYSIQVIVEEIKSNAEPEKWEELYDFINDLEEYVDVNSNFLSIYLSHEYLDVLSIQTDVLLSYVSTENIEEVSATLVPLKLQLEKIIKLQKISLENIL